MKKLSSAVILQSDRATSECLRAAMSQEFDAVYVAASIADLRHAVAKRRAHVAVLDLEIASDIEVQQLGREFPELCLVCNHRLPDEQMWMSVLQAGAADLCSSSDSVAILKTALKNVALAKAAAA